VQAVSIKTLEEGFTERLGEVLLNCSTTLRSEILCHLMCSCSTLLTINTIDSPAAEAVEAVILYITHLYAASAAVMHLNRPISIQYLVNTVRQRVSMVNSLRRLNMTNSSLMIAVAILEYWMKRNDDTAACQGPL